MTEMYFSSYLVFICRSWLTVLATLVLSVESDKGVFCCVTEVIWGSTWDGGWLPGEPTT